MKYCTELYCDLCFKKIQRLEIKLIFKKNVFYTDDLECTSLEEGTEGTIKSNTGSKYAARRDCKWTIKGDIGKKIQLEVGSIFKY